MEENTTYPRYYDPATGRFLSQDPLPGDALNPQTQDPYPYALNNPVNRVDPTGLASEIMEGGFSERFLEELLFQECFKFILFTVAFFLLAGIFLAVTPALFSATTPILVSYVASAELGLAAVGSGFGTGYSAYRICGR